ncbi:hypothetical protein AB0D29_26640 [Streptomyces sp. NPDC048424]|uniref:hypothetical protein n=1 Tax=Streptomyces sp. NPDC048424 TaxID=3155265 RepID=UPI00341E5285
MPKDDTLTTSIALDQHEVTLIVGVLDRAAADCRAAAPPDTGSDQHTGVTLGRLTARWTEIAEHERHCDVVNLHGDRLFVVSLTAESWYQVRAALGACVAQLAVEREDNAADQDRMARALVLADKIAGATNDR